MPNYIIRNAQLINDGKIRALDVLIKGKRIERIDSSFDVKFRVTEIDAGNLHVMPGIIDDQVHFREPGLTNKATIYTEAKAALAGGVTSFMEMPNTKPPATTIELLEQKYQIASQTSLANYTFYMGTSLNNFDELLKVDKQKVCGIKVFMGSSTGDMLVDDAEVLEKIFGELDDILIATHCEDDKLVQQRLQMYKERYGDNIPFECHAEIRNEEVCYNSSSFAVELAKKYNTRLHVLHISTANELKLFRNDIPLKNKRITNEVCVHHLWFDKNDYDRLGSKIKCNPSIKEAHHKKALFEAMLDDTLDVIATDHAPHTIEEKNSDYINAPSGLPLVQHSLNIMLEFYHQRKIGLEKIVDKMCHKPAECFKIKDRGYLYEGYMADLVLLDVNEKWKVTPDNILYKCAWSSFEKYEFTGTVLKTFVNGNLVYDNGKFEENIKGERLEFAR